MTATVRGGARATQITVEIGTQSAQTRAPFAGIVSSRGRRVQPLPLRVGVCGDMARRGLVR